MDVLVFNKNGTMIKLPASLMKGYIDTVIKMYPPFKKFLKNLKCEEAKELSKSKYIAVLAVIDDKEKMIKRIEENTHIIEVMEKHRINYNQAKKRITIKVEKLQRKMKARGEI